MNYVIKATVPVRLTFEVDAEGAQEALEAFWLHWQSQGMAHGDYSEIDDTDGPQDIVLARRLPGVVLY